MVRKNSVQCAILINLMLVFLEFVQLLKNLMQLMFCQFIGNLLVAFRDTVFLDQGARFDGFKFFAQGVDSKRIASIGCV